MSDLSGSFVIPPQVAMNAAAAFHHLQNGIQIIRNIATRVGWSVWRSLTPMTYVFFENTFHPWPKSDLVLNNHLAPPIAWSYTPAEHLFQQPQCQNHWRHVSWLSAQIKHGEDLVVADITEFVNGLHWIGEAAPEPEHILAAWTLETGIVLNPALPLRICIITDEGSEQTLELYKDHVSRVAQVPAVAST